MPTVQELGARLDVPVDEVIRMGEMQVQNPTSMLYRAIEDKVGQKFAAIKAHEQKNGGRKAKNRVYVQHAVPSAGRYQLVSAFPQFELVFTGVDKRAAAVAHATFIIIAEYMFSQFKVSHGMVLAYGISVKQVIMRNRTWVHVCVPGHNVRVQADFLRDDRAIIAMLNSARARGKELPLARDYAQGQAHIHCTNPHECDVQAPGGVMLLTATDTNFRQIAFYMRSHKISLQYVSIPGNKHMEMCTAGPFPELDAYVMPSDDGKYISIAYRNCGTLDMTYTYSNYLEIVARTTVVVDGVTYHKEFVNRVQGMLVYKITAITGVFDEEPVPYKSWIEPGYRNKYMVYAPVLKPYGNVKNVADWTVVAHSVDKGLIDDVVDHAMRVKGAKDLSQVIQQRLFTRTSNFALSNQIVTTSDALPLSVFEIVALSVYTTVFMRKFHDGAAVTTLAPQARELASLARSMPTQLVRMYVGTLLGNLVRSMDFVTDTLRALYYDAIGGSDLPMPAFAVCPGFVEYSDVASSNPRFMGWHTCETSDVMGFTNMLPGVKRTVIGLGTSVVSATTSVDESLIAQLCASGEGIIADGRVQFTDTTSLVEVACGVFSAVKGIFSDVPDPEESLGDDVIKATPVKVSEYSLSVPARNDLMYTQVPQSSKARAYSAQASALVERIQEGQDGLVNLGESKFSTNTPMPTSTVPTVVRGHGTEHPIEYLREGIMKIFPSSLVMSTEHFESDRQYSSWDMVAKALLLRLDVSKLSSPQPEHFYKPLLSGHVQPHVKETFNTTLHTMVKRNANTPADADPLDEEFLWENAWSATRKVFYVPGAQEQLDALEYIGPTEEAIREWVAKLDEAKESRLLGQPDGYSICELIDGASRNHLMLKAKLKPALDAAYATSVKYPQSIQYDPTGKTVAVLSPVIAEKVAREQHILKPNVMIMQGKNIDDVNRFINTFDWRPDARGERYYVEIDYTMYDKSQGKTCANFYLRKCAEFGVLPRLINFIKDHHYRRTVSSMKAGISAVLRDQNPSGAPFTLDRNNDVNMLVIAELLERILEKIEFIVMMGDDITIAVRGEVDITTWETEINRKFNLSLKASLHKHGYICSMDIVHYPSGASAVVPDVIKRSLAFLEQSLKDEDKFEERYVSFRDNMKRICDLQTQHYLCQAIPERMRTYMPTVTGEAIMLLCMAMTGFYESYEAFRSAHASQPTLRYY